MLAAAASAPLMMAGTSMAQAAAAPGSEAAARTNSEFMEAALEQQMDFLQAHVSALRHNRHERVSQSGAGAGGHMRRFGCAVWLFEHRLQRACDSPVTLRMPRRHSLVATRHLRAAWSEQECLLANSWP